MTSPRALMVQPAVVEPEARAPRPRKARPLVLGQTYVLSPALRGRLRLARELGRTITATVDAHGVVTLSMEPGA